MNNSADEEDVNIGDVVRSSISSYRRSVDYGTGSMHYGSAFGGPETVQRLKNIKKRSRQYLRMMRDPSYKHDSSPFTRQKLQASTDSL